MSETESPKKLPFIIISAISIVTVLATALWLHFLFTPIVVNKPLVYVLKQGISAQTLAEELKDQTQLKYPFLFKMLIKLRQDDPRLQAGEYKFPIGSTPSDILNTIVKGKIFNHTFTIVDGWNYRQMMEQLNTTQGLNHTLKNKSARYVAQAIGIKKYQSPEGLLFPNTYYFTKGQKDVDVLKRAYQAMRNYLADEWPERADHLPYQNFYQALIVASMVEKEASIENERPIVAAIILKRYKTWMHLQIDSTVIYGLGEQFNGKLSKEDLKLKTPYNTYLHYGLPPTPICMPGRSAIDAAFHPAKTKALYFVAKGDGSHVFSDTLEEQNKAVAKYQKPEM